MDDLAKHYRRRRNVLMEARNRLRSVLLSAVAKIEAKSLSGLKSVTSELRNSPA